MPPIKWIEVFRFSSCSPFASLSPPLLFLARSCCRQWLVASQRCLFVNSSLQPHGTIGSCFEHLVQRDYNLSTASYYHTAWSYHWWHPRTGNGEGVRDWVFLIQGTSDFQSTAIWIEKETACWVFWRAGHRCRRSEERVLRFDCTRNFWPKVWHVHLRRRHPPLLVQPTLAGVWHGVWIDRQG